VVIAIALLIAEECAFGAGRKFSCGAIATQGSTDAIAVFRFNPKAIAFSSHSTQVKAIALAVVDEYAFGEVIKFGCRAIASPSKTNAIAFFASSAK
jgi:hypothetical protein